MRLLLALLAFVLLSGATPAPAPIPVAATPEGGFRLGSARAPVQLVEYQSLTCSHCREFHETGWEALKRQYIARGLVAVELRSMVLNGPDIVATLAARCDGPAAFFRRADALYNAQSSWIGGFGDVTPGQAEAIGKLPVTQQTVALARYAKFDAFIARTGMTPTRLAACLSYKAGADRVEAMGKAAAERGVTGTPTFFLNGRRLDVNTWAGIEPSIRAALKMKPKAG